MTTLADLRTRARQQADMENSEFVSDDEVDTYLNQGYKELYGIIVTKHEDYFLEDPVTFTLTAADAGKKALAADFFKLVGVDKQVAADDWVEVRNFMFNERNRKGGLERGYHASLKYRLMGSNLRFSPAENAVGNFRYWYIPQAPTLDEDEDTVDVWNGWEEYAVLHAAIKCLAKEESDVSVLMAQKAQLRVDIEAQIGNRDSGNVQRVQDVRSGFYGCDDDWEC